MKTKNLKIEEIVAPPTPPVERYGAEIVVIYHMRSLLPECSRENPVLIDARTKYCDFHVFFVKCGKKGDFRKIWSTCCGRIKKK